jgi:adenylate kinase
VDYWAIPDYRNCKYVPGTVTTKSKGEPVGENQFAMPNEMGCLDKTMGDLSRSGYLSVLPVKAERPRPPAIVFLGAPGSGKGTQAEKVAKEYSLAHVSTGEVFRAHMAQNTPLGKQAAERICRGHLVEDEIVCRMLAEHVRALAYNGCLVLDGFPRSVAQAEWLEQFLFHRNMASYEHSCASPLVIHIRVEHQQLLRRITGRRSCQHCGRSYNLHTRPPRNSRICDHDGSPLTMRADDCESVAERRLTAYEQSNSSLVEYYLRNKQLREIDGNGSIEMVWSAIQSAIRDTES